MRVVFCNPEMTWFSLEVVGANVWETPGESGTMTRWLIDGSPALWIRVKKPL